MRRRRASLVAGLAALFLTGSASGATALQQRAASPAALTAADGLIALPWTGLAQQYVRKTQESVAALDGKRFVNAKGNGWWVRASTENMEASMNVASPPGFTASSPTGFSLRAPLNGGWSFAVSGDLKARAWAGTGGSIKSKLLDTSGSLPFALSVSDLSLAASAVLDSRDPTRPRLTSGTVQLKATIGGSGLVPSTAVSVSATRNPNGTVSLTVPVTSLSLGIFGDKLSARLTVKVVVTLYPYPATIHLRDPSEIVDLSATFLPATVSLQGDLSLRFPDPIGKKDAGFGLSFALEVPSTDAIDQALELLAGPIPLVWPPPGNPANPSGAAPPPPAAIDFATPRDTLEHGIAAHLPYGTVLSIDHPSRPVSVTLSGRQPAQQNTYGLDADSTIWTGHYLAAEAFRYASTQSPDALARVQELLGGLRRDFDVTTDAVLDNHVYMPVPPVDRGIFARSVMPSNDPLGWTDSAADRQTRGTCMYVKPGLGWQIGNRRFETLAQARAAGGTLAVRLAKPLGDKAHPILYGSGCGKGDADSPVSRDAYSGVFLGLALAYKLVPDVRPQAKDLIERALDYVLMNRWNVPLPPDNAIVTSFVGDFDAQLDLLRIGATVDPKKYGSTYARYAAASELVWIPVWLSSIDPLQSYYKFNLGHAYFVPPLLFEQNTGLRANYLYAYRILQAATATHRNAYFNLVDALVGTAPSRSLSNPALSFDDEIRSDLADWVTRWNDVKGANGMPRNATSQAAAAYLVQRWPNDIKVFTNTDGNASYDITYPLPLWARTGDGMDFVWQRSPYGAGIDAPGSTRRAADPTPGPGRGVSYSCSNTPPTAKQIAVCSSDSVREGPGVDFLLPYWLGVYLDVLPKPSE